MRVGLLGCCNPGQGGSPRREDRARNATTETPSARPTFIVSKQPSSQPAAATAAVTAATTTSSTTTTSTATTTTTATTIMESGTKKKKRSRAGRDKHRARGVALGYVQAKANEEQEEQLKAAQREAAAAQAAAQRSEQQRQWAVKAGTADFMAMVRMERELKETEDAALYTLESYEQADNGTSNGPSSTSTRPRAPILWRPRL